MAANSFGTLFRVTTWGESHGPRIGCTIDGCPAGLELDKEDIQKKLDLRRPGRHQFLSERNEPDEVEILSGIFQGKTTGTPISLEIKNENIKNSSEKFKDILKPGGANFSYLEKYGIFDWRGNGRASARETATRVAAGAVAQKFLSEFGIEVFGFLKACGDFSTDLQPRRPCERTPYFCLNEKDDKKVHSILRKARGEKDTVGGICECLAFNVPAGLGEPVFDKLSSRLSFAMMSIPSARGFEIGDPHPEKMRGSSYNDSFRIKDGKIVCDSNQTGGVLGGISTGATLVMRTSFRPISTIGIMQEALSLDGRKVKFKREDLSRHDTTSCVRAVVVCEAMCALVLVDMLLLQRCSKIHFTTPHEFAMHSKREQK
jgi:chorismate synthase